MSKTTGQRLGLFRRVSPYILPAQRAIIYKAMIRSKMEYASSAWIGATPTSLSQLDSIQNRAKRVIGLPSNEYEDHRPGGGLLKYDLDRDVPLRLESIDPFLYQILPKNETHFYTRATNFKQNLLKISHYFPKLFRFQANFGNFGIRLMKLGLFSSQFLKILKKITHFYTSFCTE